MELMILMAGTSVYISYVVAWLTTLLFQLALVWQCLHANMLGHLRPKQNVGFFGLAVTWLAPKGRGVTNLFFYPDE